VVCGHYGCGGVRAALAGGTGGHVGAWLRPLRALSRAHAAELDALSDPAAREDRLCELNVAAQVANLTRSDVVRRAWARGLRVSLHGWIYSVADGHLHALDLGSVESLGRIMPAPLASAPVRLAR
jgi:carbonic anhydrase